MLNDRKHPNRIAHQETPDTLISAPLSLPTHVTRKWTLHPVANRYEQLRANMITSLSLVIWGYKKTQQVHARPPRAARTLVKALRISVGDPLIVGIQTTQECGKSCIMQCHRCYAHNRLLTAHHKIVWK
jgi:hypothetical protein